MQESFLHYIWQLQYFQSANLLTTDGEDLKVFKAGHYNSDSGPDFSNAKIRIGTLDWVGMVEIHIKSSDWTRHNHHQNHAYENVVLHVVWEHDKNIFRKDGSAIPTLELKDRVDQTLIGKYKSLVNDISDVPCGNVLRDVDSLLVHSMLDRTMTQRLERKANEVKSLLQINNGDWEETTYQFLARYFGFKLNNEPFFQLAKSVPYKILLKHHDKPFQIESILFGQAGFLEARSKNDYLKLLRREFNLLSAKYKFSPPLHGSQWKFMRLRPANFPTVRLAQFCALMARAPQLFSMIIETRNSEKLKEILNAQQSDFWRQHYHFGSKAKREIPPLGNSSVDLVCINVVAPVLVAYGKSVDDQRFVDRAVEHLESVAAEGNKITKIWQNLGLKISTAFDSQATIELYQNFCLKRNCLNCTIGSSILKPES